MRSLDLVQQERNEILQRMSQAITNNNPSEYAQAFNELATSIQESVREEYQAAVTSSDVGIMAQRGIRQLTSEETKYYQSIIDTMKSNIKHGAPQQAVTLIDDVMPKTVIDDIFTYLTENHPLLDEIDFQNTEAITQWLMSTSSGVAGWGDLCSTIDDEISGAFSVIELSKFKLSAFIPVCNAMLDIGPEWLDRYVRTLLTEALATALELAIVDGDGNGKPLGMSRALTGAVDGVYPRKTATAVTSLDPVVYGTILNTLSQAPNSKRRAIAQVLMVVNPADYFTKVFPATTARATDGTYVKDIFPFPTKVVQSNAVPAGRAVVGLGKQYFMGLGTSQGGKLEYADQTKFLEDQRLYRIKLYGNGRPKDTNAFVYLDISGLEAYVLNVNVVNADEIGTV